MKSSFFVVRRKILFQISALAVIAPLVGCMNVLAEEITIFSDSFDDGDFTNGADPLDGLWQPQNLLVSAPAGTIVVDNNNPGIGGGNALRIHRGGAENTTSGAKVSFPEVTLDATDDFLKLEFDFRAIGTLESDDASSIRVGLFSDVGTVPNAVDDTGYYFRSSVGTLRNQVLSFKQELGLTTGPGHGPGPYSGSFSNAIHRIPDNNAYQASFLLERTGEGILATATVNGFTRSQRFDFGTDLARDSGFTRIMEYKTFDYLGIFGRVHEVRELIIDNVVVTTNVVPEPSMGALCAMGLVTIMLRRRRRFGPSSTFQKMEMAKPFLLITKKSGFFRVLALAMITPLACCLNALAGEITIFSDSFDDGSFTNGVDPLDGDWLPHRLLSSGPGTIVVDNNNPGIGTGNALRIHRGGASGTSGAKVSFPSVTLNSTDDFLKLEFDFRAVGSLDTDDASSIRVGFFTDRGTVPNFTDDQGYYFRNSVGTTRSRGFALSLKQELGLPEGIGPGHGPGPYSGSRTFPIHRVPDNAAYKATFLLERTDEGILATATVNGFTASQRFNFGEDLARDRGFTRIMEFKTFDYLGIFGREPEVEEIIIDNIVVTTNVPEPSSCALSLLGLATMALRRRRNRFLTWRDNCD